MPADSTSSATPFNSRVSRRGTSVVFVDADGAPAPQLLRLQAVGIPVAVVRPGDDLAGALSARDARVA